MQAAQLNTSTETYANPTIEDILKCCGGGKIVLSFYQKEKKLTPKLRKLLCVATIEHLLEKNIVPTPKTFEQYADQIVSLFPSEAKETYFMKIKGEKCKGSLYSKYHNTIFNLRKSGVEISKRRTDKKLFPSEIQLSIANLSDEDALCYRTWLKYNIDPFDEVLNKWSSTFQQRFSELNSETPLLKILDEWPLYKQSFGHSLINLDFKAIFPQTENNLFENWDTGCDKLLMEMRERIKDLEGKRLLLKLTNEDHSPEVRSSIVAILLHYLLPPSIKKGVRSSKNNRRLFKPTISDSISTFLIRASTSSELKSKIKDYTDHYFNEHKTVQPLICVIGENFFELKEFYVYFANIFYKFDNIVKALDICFKVYHVLNSEFPCESNLVWLFIKQFFFKMHPKGKERASSVYTLITDLNNLQD